jgi:hypothetical protein
VPTLDGALEIIVSLCSMKKALIPKRKQASRFPRPLNIARNALQAMGFHTQEISSHIPSIDKRRPMSPWPHMRCMVEQVPRRLWRSAKGRSKDALTRAVISMRRS